MEMGTCQPKRLYKSRRDRMIDGVCAGVAEYLDIDPTVLRVLWIGSIFIAGTGIWLYIAGMIIMPVNPDERASAEHAAPAQPSHAHQRFWGMMLILFGFIILLTNLGALAFLHIWNISWTILFAFMLIFLGLYFIFRSPVVGEQPSSPDETVPGNSPRASIHRFERIRKERKILGVCGGIAKYFDIEPSIVRILYVLFTFISHGFGILLYFALALILPEEEPQHV